MNYPANEPDELDIKEGDIIVVHRRRDDGWFHGTQVKNGRTGLFPSTFVKRVSYEYSWRFKSEDVTESNEIWEDMLYQRVWCRVAFQFFFFYKCAILQCCFCFERVVYATALTAR